MGNIDIDYDTATKWISENTSKMTLDDQIKIAKATMEFIELSKELYKKYNQPEPNTFFFKL